MARLNARIDDDLDKRFREVISNLQGYKNGILKEAIEEAIKLWIEAKEKPATGGIQSGEFNGEFGLA